MLALIATVAVVLGFVYVQTPAVELSGEDLARAQADQQLREELRAAGEATGAETKVIARLPSLGKRATPRSLAGTGKLVAVKGSSRRVGTGPRKRFAVQVERGLRLDADAFAKEVERILFDRRSWARQDGFSLKRTDDPGDVTFIVTLTSPTTTDRLCAPLSTSGVFSCAQGPRAVINAARWRGGAPSFGNDLMEYRRYLINHEVGHTLGRRHRDCPAPKARAPVMMQQTKGVGDCAPNPWPRTDEA